MGVGCTWDGDDMTVALGKGSSRHGYCWKLKVKWALVGILIIG